MLVEPAKAFSGIPGTTTASLVVVSYNARRYLDRCLRSVLSQSVCPGEIIVVDNASTDGSADFVEQAFPDVTVIRNRENLGFGHAANVGAALAQGDYLAFLNPDTVVEPGWLDALVAALDANEGYGLATSRILLLAQPDRVNACGTEVHYTGLTLCRGTGSPSDSFSRTEEVDAVSGAAFAIRRAVFDEIGGFDDRFFLYVEDIDLSWRARLAGHACLHVPASVVYHDYTLRFGSRKTFLQERNRYLMLLKSLRWPTLLTLVPALLLAELMTWGFVLLRDRRNVLNKPRAYLWVGRHWRQIMASRHHTQAHRRVRDHDLLARCAHRVAFEQVGAGHLAAIAHRLFDPPFLALRILTLAVVRW